MLKYFFAYLAIGLGLISCKYLKHEIMTPTIFANEILESAFKNDSLQFFDRVETASKIRQSLKSYNDLRKNMIDYENMILSDNSQFEKMKDSARIMFRKLRDSIEKFNLSFVQLDTVDFNNYVNNYRPYYKLDLEGYIHQNNEIFVLEVKEAILLSDGWNFGSVRLYKLSPYDMTLRLNDSLRNLIKLDPANKRISDSIVQAKWFGKHPGKLADSIKILLKKDPIDYEYIDRLFKRAQAGEN
ncbi:MAG: hypothetical protein IT267_01650 [Saprospiraceae bacterium]|nr:hypothetical protein [Saprospiraceae bacterium]